MVRPKDKEMSVTSGEDTLKPIIALQHHKGHRRGALNVMEKATD